MARLSDVGTVQIGELSVPLKTVVQGYASEWTGRVRDADGMPVDLTGAKIDVRVEFATCTLAVIPGSSGSRGAPGTPPTASVSNLSLLKDPRPRGLEVVIADQTNEADHGRFVLTVPADLYATEIPPDAATEVPVAIGYVRWSRADESRVARFLLAFRRGGGFPA